MKKAKPLAHKPYCLPCNRQMESFYQSPVQGFHCTKCGTVMSPKVLTKNGMIDATPTDLRNAGINQPE